MEYCLELNDRMNLDIPFTFTDTENLLIKSNGWRFPTEAEWEYLCKAGTNKQVAPNDNLNDVAWFVENSGSNIFDRGLKQPNAFGLYDMLGNVSEWCWDFYDEAYYDYGEDTINPEGPLRFDPNNPPPPSWVPEYVKRGGSINTPSSRCRSSFRMSTENDPITIGVRLVRTIQ